MSSSCRLSYPSPSISHCVFRAPTLRARSLTITFWNYLHSLSHSSNIYFIISEQTYVKYRSSGNHVFRRKYLNIIKSLYLTLIHDSFSYVSSPETDSAGCPNRFRRWPANIAPVTTRCLKPRTMKSCTPVSGIFINERLDNRDTTFFQFKCILAKMNIRNKSQAVNFLRVPFSHFWEKVHLFRNIWITLTF